MTTHSIPLYTLVELTQNWGSSPEDQVKGIRLFVVRHSRDCDGSPLYDLSFDKTAAISYDAFNAEVENMKKMSSKNSPQNYALQCLNEKVLSSIAGKILTHISSDNIRVIEQ